MIDLQSPAQCQANGLNHCSRGQRPRRTPPYSSRPVRAIHSPAKPLIENPGGVPSFSPGLAAAAYPGYSIAINKLYPEGLARALSPSASTSPQNQKPPSIPIFPLQPFSSRFKVFQAVSRLFQKKKIVYFYEPPQPTLHDCENVNHIDPPFPPHARTLGSFFVPWFLCCSNPCLSVSIRGKNNRKSVGSDRFPTAADRKLSMNNSALPRGNPPSSRLTNYLAHHSPIRVHSCPPVPPLRGPWLNQTKIRQIKSNLTLFKQKILWTVKPYCILHLWLFRAAC
jgi:hypothetical protein